MSTLNFKHHYGVVSGHDQIRYVQDGKNFDGAGKEILPEKPAPVTKAQSKKEEPVKATPLQNAKLFLIQILKENPLSKSAIYKEAENNNHNWDIVKTASAELGISKSSRNNLEMWQLPEGVSA